VRSRVEANDAKAGNVALAHRAFGAAAFGEAYIESKIAGSEADEDVPGRDFSAIRDLLPDAHVRDVQKRSAAHL
jgi:hypothetical protein